MTTSADFLKKVTGIGGTGFKIFPLKKRNVSPCFLPSWEKTLKNTYPFFDDTKSNKLNMTTPQPIRRLYPFYLYLSTGTIQH